MRPIPWAIMSDVAQSLPWSRQRLVNLFPEAAMQQARSPVALYSAAGMKEFADTGQAYIRGMRELNGVGYVVAGTKVYAFDGTGTLTAASGAAISGTGPVKIDGAPTQTGILASDGSTYVLTVPSGAGAGTVTKVTSAGYQTASDFCVMDNTGIWTVLGSQGLFVSAPGDLTSVSALDTASAEKLPDNLVGCVTDKDDLFLAGRNSVEVWYNSGNPDFPFERRGGGLIERGCLSAKSIVKEDNSWVWLGEDRIVWRLANYTPTRLSNHGLEKKLRGYSNSALSSSVGFTFTQRGHKFYALCVSEAEAAHVYDFATGVWHDRETWRNDAGDLWRANCAVNAFGKVLIGDRYSGKIYELDEETYTDAGGVLRRQLTGAPLQGARNPIFADMIQLDMEVGVGLTTGQGSDPQVMMDHTDDGKVWSNERWRPIGKIGEYRNRVRWPRGGRFYDRTYRFTVTDPIPVTFYALYGEWTGG